MRTRNEKLGLKCFVLLMALIIPTMILTNLICDAEMRQPIVLKEEWTESIVQDEYGMLTPLQVECVKDLGRRLKMYSFGLCVVDREGYSIERLKEIAESKYNELMPENNSILLTLAMDHGEVVSYGVICNIQGKVSERRVKKICDKFFARRTSVWFTDTVNEIVTEFVISEWNLIHYFDPTEVWNRDLMMIQIGLTMCFAFVIEYIYIRKTFMKPKFI